MLRTQKHSTIVETITNLLKILVQTVIVIETKSPDSKNYFKIYSSCGAAVMTLRQGSEDEMLIGQMHWFIQ